MDNDVKALLKILSVAAAIVIAMIGLGAWGMPHYNVWQQGMVGRAMLEKAEHEKKITIEAAKAKLESASLEADAELARAKGLSKAIETVGEMAKKYPEYRQQLFIEGFAEALREGKVSQVIYVPTEANIPILEAGKKH